MDRAGGDPSDTHRPMPTTRLRGRRRLRRVGIWAARAGAAFAGLIITGVAGVQVAAGSAVALPPAFTTVQAPDGSGTAGQKVIALTFDDGPGPYTPQVLAVLQQFGVPATFFDIGVNVAAYPQNARQVSAAGYPVENHTWSHPDLARLVPAALAAQIDLAQSEITTVTGVAPVCLRPPYDAWNVGVLSQIAARGLATMSYSVDPQDWKKPGVNVIAYRTVGGARPGAVVDLHDGGGDRSQTVAALPQIITSLRAKGYTFVSICGPAPGSTPTGSTAVTAATAPVPPAEKPANPHELSAVFGFRALSLAPSSEWLYGAPSWRRRAVGATRNR